MLLRQAAVRTFAILARCCISFFENSVGQTPTFPDVNPAFGVPTPDLRNGPQRTRWRRL
jgi:hypothetical protein